MNPTYATTSQKKANTVITSIAPRTKSKIAPAMLTTIDWIIMTNAMAVPSKMPRDTPVTHAKMMMGPEESKTRDERNI